MSSTAATVAIVVLAILAVLLAVQGELQRREAKRGREALDALAQELEQRRLTHPYSEQDKEKALTGSKNKLGGRAVEQMAPLLRGYPYDPRFVRFLGDRIDQIAFVEDVAGDLWVVLIEIKKGTAGLKAGLKEPQQAVRCAVLEGRVLLQVVRVVDGRHGAYCEIEETNRVETIPPPSDSPYPGAPAATPPRPPLFSRPTGYVGRTVRVRPPEQP